MPLSRLIQALPARLRALARRLYRHYVPPPPEPLMYRRHLFEELMTRAGKETFHGRRILEIGPRDGLDSLRLASLEPAELVMVDLPEKRELVASWLKRIAVPYRYIEMNIMYMPAEEISELGSFDLIWCTGVIYHNAEQLRFLRKLHKMLAVNGYLVLESSTLRGPKSLRDGCYVQIHYPQTYRETGTVTHLPTAKAIKAWLEMVGFSDIQDSRCFERHNRNLIGLRMACIAHKTEPDSAAVYYGKSGLNPDYRLGDAV